MGSLSVIGLGYDTELHLTPEARRCIEDADRVIAVVGDSAAFDYVRSLNPAIVLLPFHGGTLPDSSRAKWSRIVSSWMGHIIDFLACSETVCVAFKGHPGVGLQPAHALIARARQAGHSARMYPAISAADLLYSEMGLDPLTAGCQHFDATDFLIRRRAFSTSVPMVLWQVGLIGAPAQSIRCVDVRRFRILCDVLGEWYGSSHKAILYEKKDFRVPSLPEPEALHILAGRPVSEESTLFVPPNSRPALNPAMLDRLGLSEDTVNHDFPLPD